MVSIKIKIFRGPISLVTDPTNGIESKINQFIEGKDIVDIKQSVSFDDTGIMFFIAVTVMYNE
jgi:hypothetical protein